jgi:hypothetical protein
MQVSHAMGFEQATIKIEREREFDLLKGAINRVFAGPVEQFLKQVQRSGKRVRDFEAVVANGLLERADEALAKSGTTAQRLYQALTVSDQGQLREFYLFKIEEVAPELRARFHKLYQYY